MSKKRKVGKPKIQLSDLPEFYKRDGELYNTQFYSTLSSELGEHQTTIKWSEAVLTEMSQGASLEEIKGLLDISNTTHTRLMKEEKQYSETIKRGLRLSRRWWEKQGRQALRNKDFSYTGWYMNMKNRFKWRDRQDVTSDDEKISGVVIHVPEKNEE